MQVTCAGGSFLARSPSPPRASEHRAPRSAAPQGYPPSAHRTPHPAPSARRAGAAVPRETGRKTPPRVPACPRTGRTPDPARRSAATDPRARPAGPTAEPTTPNDDEPDPQPDPATNPGSQPPTSHPPPNPPEEPPPPPLPPLPPFHPYHRCFLQRVAEPQTQKHPPHRPPPSAHTPSPRLAPPLFLPCWLWEACHGLDVRSTTFAGGCRRRSTTSRPSRARSMPAANGRSPATRISSLAGSPVLLAVLSESAAFATRSMLHDCTEAGVRALHSLDRRSG